MAIFEIPISNISNFCSSVLVQNFLFAVTYHKRQKKKVTHKRTGYLNLVHFDCTASQQVVHSTNYHTDASAKVKQGTHSYYHD
jgi:hypothetical protein